MVLTKTVHAINQVHATVAKKRRNRRKKAQAIRNLDKESKFKSNIFDLTQSNINSLKISIELDSCSQASVREIISQSNANLSHNPLQQVDCTVLEKKSIANMSSKEIPQKSREDVIAAREAKKLAKQNAKSKTEGTKTIPTSDNKAAAVTKNIPLIPTNKNVITETQDKNFDLPKGKDEVDKAKVIKPDINAIGEKTKEQIKAEREAKKLQKLAKRKVAAPDGDTNNVTKQSVENTLENIIDIAKDIHEVTAKVNALLMKVKAGKSVEGDKSKSDLKAQRRAKQEAQRAAKQTLQSAKPIEKPEVKLTAETKMKEMLPKLKAIDRPKAKSQISNRMNLFQHLYSESSEETLKKASLNSNIHPAVIKLGVQLASRVVTGSNARVIALLDALKKMVTDYTLPAKTEFARGLESHLSTSLEYLWSMRQPSASQTNAVKYFRYHLTQLPNTVSEFDAKKILHEEIDRYIREQIEMAGEAISIAVRNKISSGDYILTFGCSSLIERILLDAHSAGVQYRCAVVGSRVSGGAREMIRRLRAGHVQCTYLDITALSDAMRHVNKVLLGASSLLVNGSVLGAVGTAQVALTARAFNVPVLVCCETHKFSERVQTDAFVYNELGNPDDLIDKSDENSPLKDWRSNQNLTLLNLTYDLTPASLVTAVVTELAILPCTSAPVVLRFKLSEYGI